ncbi:Uncharacterized protein FKW44_014714, partial [Caligus rogercresseyi]
MKSSKTVAKLATRRREQLRRQCDGLVEELKTRIIRLEVAVPPTEEDVDIATTFSEEVGKRLDRLEEAVLECQAFKDDEEDAEDDSFDHVNGLRIETISEEGSRRSSTKQRPAPADRYPRLKAFNFSALSEVDQDISLRGFKEWRKKWESNGKLFNLTSFSRDIQVHSLLTAIGAHAGRIIVTHYAMDLEDEGTTVTLILDNLQAYYRSQRNLTVDRVNFVRRKQGPHETFDQFRFALADMADDAELCQTCREEQIVTRIIAGITDEKARCDLLKEREFPTLERAVTVCLASEVASINQATLSGSTINKVSLHRQSREKAKTRNRRQSSSRRPPKEGDAC